MLRALRQRLPGLSGSAGALLFASLLLAALSPCLAHSQEMSAGMDMAGGEHDCPHCAEDNAGCAESATVELHALAPLSTPQQRLSEPDHPHFQALLPALFRWRPPPVHRVLSVSDGAIAHIERALTSRFCRFLE